MATQRLAFARSPMTVSDAERSNWSLGEAQELIEQIELPLLSLGYMLTMRGEVLTQGSGPQLNFILVPLLPSADSVVALSSIETMLRAMRLDIEPHHAVFKPYATPRREIDVIALRIAAPL